jgi:hypothetical protein
MACEPLTYAQVQNHLSPVVLSHIQSCPGCSEKAHKLAVPAMEFLNLLIKVRVTGNEFAQANSEKINAIRKKSSKEEYTKIAENYEEMYVLHSEAHKIFNEQFEKTRTELPESTLEICEFIVQHAVPKI